MTDLFNQPPLPYTGKQLRDTGIRIAAESAERKHEGWNNECYARLLEYIKTHKRFVTEDFRASAAMPDPPSNRAYGSVIVRAAKAGLIRKVGAVVVNNPKAHRCYASSWEVVDK